MSSCPALKHALPTFQTIVAKQACKLRGMHTLSSRIDHALPTADKSAADAAKACRVSTQSVYSWMRGDVKNLRNEHLFALATLTQFEARWLATGEGPERPVGQLNPRVAQILKAMEDMPDYLIDKVVDDVESLRKLADKIKRDGTSG